MARGRMINKKISASKRVNDLPPEAVITFCFLISHLDVNGIFFGSPEMVKSLVVPRRPSTIKQVENYLRLMEKAVNDAGIPLIKRFQSNGDSYLYCPGFRDEQPGLRPERERAEYPEPPAEIQQLAGNKPADIPQKSRKPAAPLSGGNPAEVNGKLREVNGKLRELPPTPLKPEVAKVVLAYKGFTRLKEIGEADWNIINDWLDQYSVKDILDACQECVNQNKTAPSYCSRILERWKLQGRDNGQKESGKKEPEEWKLHEL